MHRFAACFTANDAVADWCAAAWTAFRLHAPDLPAFLIPFGGPDAGVRRLAARHRIGIFEPPALIDFEAACALAFPGTPLHNLRTARKFAAFELPAERFLFLDVDIVLLADPDLFLAAADAAGADLLGFDVSMDFVYADPEFASRMERDHGSRGLNAGAYISRHGLLDRATLRSRASEAAAARLPLALTWDQALLNLALDLGGHRVRTLAEMDASWCAKPWAGIGTPAREGAVWRMDAPAHPQWHGRRLPFYHWANYRLSSTLPAQDHFDHFRLLGLPPLARTRWRTARSVARTLPALRRRLPRRLHGWFDRHFPTHK